MSDTERETYESNGEQKFPRKLDSDQLNVNTLDDLNEKEKTNTE